MAFEPNVWLQLDGLGFSNNSIGGMAALSKQPVVRPAIRESDAYYDKRQPATLNHVCMQVSCRHSTIPPFHPDALPSLEGVPLDAKLWTGTISATWNSKIHWPPSC